MGATSSRSPPATRVVPIYDYSKLARTADKLTVDTIPFRDLHWDVTVEPYNFDEGLADDLLLSVVIEPMRRFGEESLLDMDISIEILDGTGEGTVFHEESDAETLQAERRVMLAVSRAELEASSCVRDDDSFAVRCTLSKKRPRCHTLAVGSFSRLKQAAPPVAMAGSHTLAVGGCRWYFQFHPNGLFRLVRASNDDTPATAEFRFELEGGAVSFASQTMTHTFDRANPEHLSGSYRLDASAHDDRLLVRCRLAVLTPRTAESLATPLLSAMYM